MLSLSIHYMIPLSLPYNLFHLFYTRKLILSAMEKKHIVSIHSLYYTIVTTKLAQKEEMKFKNACEKVHNFHKETCYLYPFIILYHYHC
jgi:hypothetical protein